MYLKEVRIKNFRGYGQNPNTEHGYYEFKNLDSNLVVLNGFNGNGKTSFFEAIEWCLTDKVTRLESFQKIYDVNTLKKSHYLKFFPLNSKKTERNRRLISVELIFDNGIHIKRDSQSNFLKVSDADRYSSQLSIQKDGQTVKEQDFLNSFINSVDNSWKEQIVNTHFLGQENMNAFYRTKKPGARRSVLMQLLNLNELEELYEVVDSLKLSGKMRSKPPQITEALDELKNKRDQINEVFQVNKWGDIKQYLQILNDKSKKLHEYVDANLLSEELALSSFRFEELTLENFKIKLKKLEVEKDRISRLLTIRKEKRDENIKIKSTVGNLALLKSAVEINKKIDKLKFLLETDLDLVEEYQKKLTEGLGKQQSEVGNLEKSKESLSVYEESFSRLNKFLNNKKLHIVDGFWTEYINSLKQIKKYFSFCMENQLELEDRVSLRTAIKEFKWSKLRTNLSSLVDKSTKLKSEIAEKDTELKTLLNLTDKYTQVLSQVKQFIIDNKDEIHQCPICLNSDFSNSNYESVLDKSSEELNNAEKLLRIIDTSISSGNPIAEQLSQKITLLKKEQVDVTQEIKKLLDMVTKNIDRLSKIFEANYNRAAIELNEKIDSIALSIKNNKRDLTKIKNQIKRYKESCKELFETEEYSREQINTMLTQSSTDNEKLLIEIKDKLNLSFIPTIEEIEKQYASYIADETVKKYYPDNIKLLDSDLEKLNRIIEQVHGLVDNFNDLLQYKLPQQYDELFDGITNIDKRIEIETTKLNKVERYKEFINTVHENFEVIHKKIVDDILQKNPMINWIYETITPHPFFKSVRIAYDKKGTNTKNESGDIFLDQIFSTAQLNVLALSIFLGLGISQKYSNLNQLFMDDPIQSMDDVNILAFIDVIRALMDSELKDKKIILSTHDDNFAKLLSIKMRNKQFAQYNFVGYGSEGPLVFAQT